ncbi:MAG: SMC-Scp complex subunit ScpB [Gammaproteobacteria bacterium]|nr:SMC-Scp complex subunit ScpB [Gammaproteobacteria bacterium]MCP5423819.1 SMC-Scp complex subunit ScpB [Gammaproteobacteria bacterium]
MLLPELKFVLEAALLAADEPLSMDRLQNLFEDNQQPSRDTVQRAVADLRQDYAGRSIELVEVASGFRIQVRQEFAPWVSRLWEERSARYSRALLETLALIAYRQPITRGEIEDVRGVSVSTSIIKTLVERSWIKVVGHREVPGRPALYGTTKVFLDYFNLRSLADLPPLSEIRDLEAIGQQLDLLRMTADPVPDPPLSSETNGLSPS